MSDGEEEIGGDSVVRWLDAAGRSFDAAIVFDGGFVEPRGWPLLTIGMRGIVTGSARVAHGLARRALGHLRRRRAERGARAGDADRGTRARDGLTAGRAAQPRCASRRPGGDRQLGDAAGGASASWRWPASRRSTPTPIAEFYERTLARPTFDVNAITCRDASQQRTIIPCEADVAFSLRLVPDQTGRAVWAALVEHLDGAGAGRRDDRARALGRRRRAARSTRRCRRCRSRAGRWPRRSGTSARVARTGGAIPLVPALHRHGVPTILSGVAMVGGQHPRAERAAALSNYEAGVRAARLLFRELAALSP